MGIYGMDAIEVEVEGVTISMGAQDTIRDLLPGAMSDRCHFTFDRVRDLIEGSLRCPCPHCGQQTKLTVLTSVAIEMTEKLLRQWQDHCLITFTPCENAYRKLP